MPIFKIGELVTINPDCAAPDPVARVQCMDGVMVQTDDGGIFHCSDLVPLTQTPDEWMDQDVEAWMELVGLPL